jgi:hypothetical protein
MDSIIRFFVIVPFHLQRNALLNLLIKMNMLLLSGFRRS